MAAGQSKPVAGGASRARSPAVGAARPRSGKNPPDLAEIDAKAPSRDRRATLKQALAENDALRRELDDARARIVALERLADEDALAPIANRRAFVRELSRMIAFTRRYGPPSSVVYFDVNNMKQINDTYGHPAGDAALRHVADVLCKNVRSADIVGRLGGDEFGVILTQTNQEQAAAKAAALAEEIASSPLRWGKVKIGVSAAYGVYSFSGSDDAHDAIEAADREMYKHKRVTAG